MARRPGAAPGSSQVTPQAAAAAADPRDGGRRYGSRPHGDRPLDGRHRRRARNRQLVIDAAASLFREGDLQPGVAAIARRAGVSVRSLFRYFDDLDDLVQAVITDHLDRARPHLAITVEPDAPQAERIDEVVRSRLALWEAVGPTARVARMRAPVIEAVAAELGRNRAAQRQQLAALFAPELADLPPRLARALLDGIDVWCSFETYDLLRHGHGRRRSEVGTAMRRGLAALLRAEETD